MARAPRVRVDAVTPFLWYARGAEEAARFYTSLLAGSAVTNVTRLSGSKGKPGPVLTAEFHLAGRPFVALNGGGKIRFTEAFSLQLSCRDQRSMDRLYDALVKGGKPSLCGWLTDRYGLSWQVIPTRLPELIGGSDAEGAGRAMAAMMKMRRIDLATLERAYRGD